jgi:hypothetical protein
MESEQFKMIDQEGAREHDHPTNERQRGDHHGHFGILDGPDNGRHRTPLPEQQQERQACAQHIGAALERPRNKPRPPVFKRFARHDAMLNGK